MGAFFYLLAFNNIGSSCYVWERSLEEILSIKSEGFGCWMTTNHNQKPKWCIHTFFSPRVAMAKAQWMVVTTNFLRWILVHWKWCAMYCYQVDKWHSLVEVGTRLVKVVLVTKPYFQEMSPNCFKRWYHLQIFLVFHKHWTIHLVDAFVPFLQTLRPPPNSQSVGTFKR